MKNPELIHATWRKSSHSNGQAACVEIAVLADARVALRDSKDPAGPALVLTPGEWRAFVGDVAGGVFDLR